MNAAFDGTVRARDLSNEPLSTLTAARYAEIMKEWGGELGIKVTVLEKKQIESLKMGGLLAVNRGSIDPPTFTIMEWSPEDAINEKPVVLVGKGVVYDTGGLSLKPTANSMDFMKVDMAGSAAVVGAMVALAETKLPIRVIGLVPATDNRPGENAYAPGDVIKMFDGTTVEVLNTDAEGRMIMADALAYAKKFDPELVIDLATLTGSAAMAIGKYGVVAMGNADEPVWKELHRAADSVHERLAVFPFWSEYRELLDSDIADLKNIGGPEGGAITAGKFLEHFTDYPYVHFDIAGPAWLKKKDKYRTKNATGVGVRLLFEYFLQRTRYNER
ncbi:MAG: leucyl aminopeptidase [Flavobacteriales bacterium]|nr:leucyl aminopeptidase [Flavobacteriales bacterium]